MKYRVYKTVILSLTIFCAYGKNGAQRNLSILKQQYGLCRQERINLLQSCDNNNFLNTILTLYRKNNQLEQAHKISSVQHHLGTIICNITQANGKEKSQLCSLIRKLDAQQESFRTKYHQPMASIEREIAELTQQFLNSMPKQTKIKLQELLKQHHDLADKLRRLDPQWMQEQQRQQTIFELLFI